MNNRASLIYCISSSIKNSIQQILNIEDLNFHTESQSFLFQTEINSFSKLFQLNYNEQCSDLNKIQIKQFFEIVKPCISGYLIQKAYQKSKKNRFDYSNEKFLPEFDELSTKDYITLSNMKISNLFVEKIYLIKTEQIFLLQKINKQNDFKQRFLLETNCPFLPRYYESKAGLFIEYIDGETLNNIKKMKLNDETKLKIIFEILFIMIYFHKNESICKYLKPSNFIIDCCQRTVFMYFDQIKNDDENNSEFGFIAPEIKAGETFSYESDIYSFGIFIYFILNEKYPEIDLSQENILPDFVVSEKYSRIKQICFQCSNKNSKLRPNISEIITFFKLNFYSELIDTFSTGYDTIINYFPSNIYEDFIFQELPLAYLSMIKEIKEEVIQNMYSKFTFSLIPSSITKNENLIKFLLFDILKDFKLIIYNISATQLATICVEKKCIIVDQISFELMNKIADKLSECDCSVINVSTSIQNDEKSKEAEVKKEIKGFILHFKYKIEKNKFVKLTIPSIIGYLIRRYFYPTEFFNDPSFFWYKECESYDDHNYKQKLNSFVFSKDPKIEINHPKLSSLIGEIRDHYVDVQKQSQIEEFHESDFVLIEPKFNNEKAIFYLAIHCKSLFIFLIKKMKSFNDSNSTNEIHFCQNYSHRCLTKFYGFLMKDEKIIGFVYEYLTNGSLYTYLSSKQNNVNEFYLLMVINRVFQGIDYLKSKSLIHRDLKPQNILLDHNFIPYISDFETIRHPLNEQEHLSNSQFTNDIGSFIYSSPEQQNGEFVSYPTDIYSFGKILNFLIYEKETNSDNALIKSSEKLLNLYESCTKNSPTERSNNEVIKRIIIDEVNLFYYYEKYILNDSIKSNEIIPFILESLVIEKESLDDLNRSFDDILMFQLLFALKSENDRSSFYIKLGEVYDRTNFIPQDFLRAKEYYELASKLHNPEAFLRLGYFYLNGLGVQTNYIIAKQYFELAANLNNSDAFYVLGNMYTNGTGIEINYEIAKKYFELAAQHNNSQAINYLGYFYKKGLAVEKNYAIAKQYFERAAELNDSHAFINLADLYAEGCGVEIDYSKVAYYFELAAKQNHPTALNNLGVMYRKGLYFKQNYQKAKEYYELAAPYKDPTTLCNLAELYEDGVGVQKDYSIAKYYYDLACEQNSPNAIHKIGYFYDKGFGVKQDFSIAKEYYERSAAMNYIGSFNELGNLYFFGKGVQQDYLKAKEYYELAAQLNSPVGFINLGNLYLNGFGVSKDYSKAKYYFELASKQNDYKAFNYLGILYKNGYGVQQDYLKAKEYFELAASMNDASGLVNLGNLYYEGCGVQQNYLKAKEYYELSAKQNFSVALNNLGILYLNGFGVSINYSTAKYYFELAANQNEFNALFNLGKMYANGIGVEVNILKSKEYFELAAKQDCPEAFFELGIYYENNKDYIKAKEYYELALKHNYLDAFNNLGSLFLGDKGFPIEIPRAIYYYNQAANLGDQFALLNLAYIYKSNHFKGVKQDYSKALEYYKLATKYNNSYAYLYIGDFYKNGYGVQQDYKKAIEYYFVSAQLGNSYAYLKIGNLYRDGRGVKQDYTKAIEYYEKSAQQINSAALFNLGYIYSTGEFIEVDIKKSIHYYSKCITSKDDYVIDERTIFGKYNKYFYRSNNDLGLIYLTVFKDIEKANTYIKEAGLNEYPFGQNNYGLLFQFFFDNLPNAEYMYERASKHNFSLAEYNLGYLKEKDGKTEEAIQFYIKASEHEKEPLIFHGHNHIDKRLEVSKKFIILFTNLKVVDYFLSKSDFEQAKIYFNKSFSSLINQSYEFHFRFNNQNLKNCLSYLKKFIFNYPLFNLKDQPYIDLKLISEEEEETIEGNNKLFKKLNGKLKMFDEIRRELNNNELSLEEEVIYEDLDDLFNAFIYNENENLKKFFIDEIKEILVIMNSILYTPPFHILFGRINIANLSLKANIKSFPYMKNINHFFMKVSELKFNKYLEMLLSKYLINRLKILYNI